MGIVEYPVERRVGDGRIGQEPVPVLDRYLGSHQGGAPVIAVLEDFQQISALLGIQGREPPVIEHQQVVLRDGGEAPCVTAFVDEFDGVDAAVDYCRVFVVSTGPGQHDDIWLLIILPHQLHVRIVAGIARSRILVMNGEGYTATASFNKVRLNVKRNYPASTLARQRCAMCLIGFYQRRLSSLQCDPSIPE